MKRQLVVLSGFVLALLAAPMAHAQTHTTDTFKTVTMVGAAEDQYGLGTPTGYFRVAESLTLSCPLGAIYIDLSLPAGKVILETATLAKVIQKRLSRLDYYMQNGVCWALLVEIEN